MQIGLMSFTMPFEIQNNHIEIGFAGEILVTSLTYIENKSE